MASGIKGKSTKTITLPSGAEVSVRALTAYDQVLIVGDLPSSIKNLEDPEGTKTRIQDFFLRQSADSVRITRLLYLRAVTSEKFVDKHPSECKEGETSIYVVPDEDFLEIQKGVDSLKKVSMEDAEKARPFPAEQEPDGGDPRSVENIRETADGTSGS